VAGTLGAEGEIQLAVMEAIRGRRVESHTRGGIDYQVGEVQVSQDRGWATAWILVYDPALDMYLPTEPGMAVLQWVGGAWQVILPSDPDWPRLLNDLPADLLSGAEKDMWLAMDQGASVEGVDTAPDTGYKLPWQGGVTGYLSRSVAHDEDYTTAHYSFDFFFLGPTICPTSASIGVTGVSSADGYNFDIYAAKAGTVWTYKIQWWTVITRMLISSCCATTTTPPISSSIYIFPRIASPMSLSASGHRLPRGSSLAG
jgi:hypothetical protein